MLLRKDVNVYLYNPAKRYFNIVLELQNVPGALHNVLQIMGGLRLNILGSFSSADSAARVGVWSGFVEDSSHKADDIRRKLSASPYVQDAMVVESCKGFLVDGVHFPLAYNTGDRAVMMKAKAVANMLGTVMEKFGTGGNVILYEEGRSYGKDSAEEYVKLLGEEFISSNLLEVMKLYQALGWFKVEEAKVDPAGDVITVRAIQNFECEGAKSGSPHSHFVRGHLEGMVSVWLGQDMVCRETKCTAIGDEFCEFSLGPRASVQA